MIYDELTSRVICLRTSHQGHPLLLNLKLESQRGSYRGSSPKGEKWLRKCLHNNSTNQKRKTKVNDQASPTTESSFLNGIHALSKHETLPKVYDLNEPMNLLNEECRTIYLSRIRKCIG